jgi:biotin transporter BioY
MTTKETQALLMKKVMKIQSIKRQEIAFSLPSLVLIFACAFLIVISTFLQFNVTHFVIPFGGGESLRTYQFIPQIPVVLFVGALLGRKYGLSAVVIYIITGLFIIPVFALGGGWRYILEYGFGYILAYIPAVFFTTSILQSGFSNRNIAQASLVGVLTIHLIGVIYMFLMAGIHQEGWAFMSSWISAQSGAKIIYDFIFSFCALFFARYAKIITDCYL